MIKVKIIYGCQFFSVCVVCCIFTLFVSQLQEKNTCLVGSGLLQGSSTSWPIHSVSPDPCNPCVLFFSDFLRGSGEILPNGMYSVQWLFNSIHAQYYSFFWLLRLYLWNYRLFLHSAQNLTPNRQNIIHFLQKQTILAKLFKPLFLKMCFYVNTIHTNHNLNKHSKHQLCTDSINDKHLWLLLFLCAGHSSLECFAIHTIDTHTCRYPTVCSVVRTSKTSSL